LAILSVSWKHPDQRVIRFTGIDPSVVTGERFIYNGEREGLAQGTVEEITMGIISRLWSRNSEGVYNGSLDYSYKITSWLTAKAGTLHQWKSRAMDRRIYTVHEANTDINTGWYTSFL